MTGLLMAGLGVVHVTAHFRVAEVCVLAPVEVNACEGAVRAWSVACAHLHSIRRIEDNSGSELELNSPRIPDGELLVRVVCFWTRSNLPCHRIGLSLFF